MPEPRGGGARNIQQDRYYTLRHDTTVGKGDKEGK